MKTKTNAIAIPDASTLGSLVAEALSLQSAIDAADNTLDAEIEAAKARHADAQAASLQRLSDLDKAIRKHVTRNRQSLMGDERHVDLPGGVRVGFRLAPWSVEKLDAEDTWDDIAQDIEEAGLEQFLNRKVSVNKQAILGAKEAIPQAQLTAMGIVFAQAENLYMEVVK